MTYKAPVCVRPEYTIYMQDIDGTAWAHCDVRKWSKEIARRLQKDAETVASLQDRPIFAVNEPTGCAKHQKFLALMGFQFYKTLPAKDGGECLIYRRG